MKELQLSPDCSVTKGYLLTIIQDLRRQRYYTIPTDSDFLEDPELRDNLISEEILLNLSAIELVPLTGKHETPSIIDVLLIENYIDTIVITGVLKQFFITRIGFVLDAHSLSLLAETLEQIIPFDLEVVEVFLSLPTLTRELIDHIVCLIAEYPLLFFTVFSEDPSELLHDLIQVRVVHQPFTYTWRRMTDSFFVNFDFYFEASTSNSAFNKRLFLDQTGTFFESFHKQHNLGTDYRQISLDGLQDIWNTTKANFDVCKSCEFRFMCLDFRYPHKRNATDWYYKEECSYNPYIAKWSHEEGYLTLMECGVISNEKECSIDHVQLALINKELWGE